jgi:type II secretory pathway pseudopilin PulG
MGDVKVKKLTSIVIIVTFGVLYYFLSINFNFRSVTVKKKDTNKNSAIALQQALQGYISETGDKNLKFGGNSSKNNIEDLFKILQKN